MSDITLKLIVERFEAEEKKYITLINSIDKKLDVLLEKLETQRNELKEKDEEIHNLRKALKFSERGFKIQGMSLESMEKELALTKEQAELYKSKYDVLQLKHNKTHAIFMHYVQTGDLLK